jgi:hypothetical protein
VIRVTSCLSSHFITTTPLPSWPSPFCNFQTGTHFLLSLSVSITFASNPLSNVPRYSKFYNLSIQSKYPVWCKDSVIDNNCRTIHIFFHIYSYTDIRTSCNVNNKIPKAPWVCIHLVHKFWYQIQMPSKGCTVSTVTKFSTVQVLHPCKYFPRADTRIEVLHSRYQVGLKSSLGSCVTVSCGIFNKVEKLCYEFHTV